MSNHPNVRTPLTVRTTDLRHNQQKQRDPAKSQQIKPCPEPTSAAAASTPKTTTSTPNATSEVLVSSWLCLPHSRFGIQYYLGSTTTSRTPLPSQNLTTGMSILQLAVTRSPFEFKMQELKKILESKFSNGAGFVYIREFLEPQDRDFPHAKRALRHPITIRTVDLNQEQVSRLRLLILNNRRQSVLISTLKSFATYSSTRQVLDHIEAFKQYYSKTRDHVKKLDAILVLTIALYHFTGWMFQTDCSHERSKMVEGLATRWRNLLATQTPSELDLDVSFSFPALLHLLQDFKRFLETAPTYGIPRMVFRYHPAALASEFVACNRSRG